MKKEVTQAAMNIFYHLRDLGLERAPTTREILNWLKYMKQFATKEALVKMGDLDGIGALVKTQTDLEKIQRHVLRNPEDFKKRSLSN